MAKQPTTSIRQALAQPKIYKLVCCYCTGAIGRGKLDIDGEAAHATCHREACK